jgi:hypothetical protein
MNRGVNKNLCLDSNDEEWVDPWMQGIGKPSTLRKNGEQIWVENDSTKRSVRNNDCV